MKLYTTILRAINGLGFLLWTTDDHIEADAVAIVAGTGAPSGDTYGGQTILCDTAIALREDGTVDQVLSITVDQGANWEVINTAAYLASTAGAGAIGILDAGGIITATTVEGALAENRTAIDVLEAVERPWPIYAMGAWAVDGDGVFTNGAGLVGTEATSTALAAANVFCYDATNAEYNLLSATSGGTDYTADFQAFSDTHADGDILYIGSDVPFCEVGFDVSATVGVYGGAALTPEYWNGAAWVTLTLTLDNTGTTATDGTTLGERDGAVSFVPPVAWASTTVDAFTGYLIRFRVTTTANITTEVILSDEPALVSPSKPLIAAATGTITDLYLAGAEATLGSAADTKFILMNYTTGLHSGELTWTKSTRAFSWTGLTLAVTAGDELGFMVTQEDGTNEHANVVGSVFVTI